MLGAGLIILGALLMVIGGVTLDGWVSGRGGRLGRAVAQLAGNSKTDRQFLGLYFLVLVVAPLLGGAVLIAIGLGQFP